MYYNNTNIKPNEMTYKLTFLSFLSTTTTKTTTTTIEIAKQAQDLLYTILYKWDNYNYNNNNMDYSFCINIVLLLWSKVQNNNSNNNSNSKDGSYYAELLLHNITKSFNNSSQYINTI